MSDAGRSGRSGDRPYGFCNRCSAQPQPLSHRGRTVCAPTQGEFRVRRPRRDGGTDSSASLRMTGSIRMNIAGSALALWAHSVRPDAWKRILRLPLRIRAGSAQNDNGGRFPPSTVHSPLSTAHSPLSTVHCPLSTLHSQLSTVHSPLSTVYCPLSALNCPLSTVHCPLSTLHSPLSTVNCCRSSPDRIQQNWRRIARRQFCCGFAQSFRSEPSAQCRLRPTALFQPWNCSLRQASSFRGSKVESQCQSLAISSRSFHTPAARPAR